MTFGGDLLIVVDDVRWLDRPTVAVLTFAPVGGRIVTETLIGLLRADPTSFLNVFPRFQPFLGADLKLGANPNPTSTSGGAVKRG